MPQKNKEKKKVILKKKVVEQLKDPFKAAGKKLAVKKSAGFKAFLAGSGFGKKKY